MVSKKYFPTLKLTVFRFLLVFTKKDVSFLSNHEKMQLNYAAILFDICGVNGDAACRSENEVRVGSFAEKKQLYFWISWCTGILNLALTPT